MRSHDDRSLRVPIAKRNGWSVWISAMAGFAVAVGHYRQRLVVIPFAVAPSILDGFIHHTRATDPVAMGRWTPNRGQLSEKCPGTATLVSRDPPFGVISDLLTLPSRAGTTPTAKPIGSLCTVTHCET